MWYTPTKNQGEKRLIKIHLFNTQSNGDIVPHANESIHSCWVGKF